MQRSQSRTGWQSTLAALLALPLLGFSLYAEAGAPAPPSPNMAIIGYNGASPDGISFVALEDLPSSTKYYFTDSEYDDASGVFDQTTPEAIWSYTTPAAGLAAGQVVVITETAANTLSLTCSGGSGATCGSTLYEPTSNTSFSLSSSSFEGVYAYTDSNNIHSDGFGGGEIHSVIYTQGNIPANEDPTNDFPNAVVVDGLTANAAHDHFDWQVSRVNVLKPDAFENPANYIPTSTGNAALDTTAFTFASAADPVITLGLAPDTVA